MGSPYTQTARNEGRSPEAGTCAVPQSYSVDQGECGERENREARPASNRALDWIPER